MSHLSDDEWSESERQAFQALPRERRPDWRLEENTVEHLRRQGLLKRPATQWWRRAGLPWAGAAAALLAAVFLAGLSVGQRWGAQSTAEALVTVQQGNLMQAAARVQQTGSDYVNALSALSRLAASTEGTGTEQLSQSREVAVAALYAAASEVILLDPNDPLAARILQGLEIQQRQSRPPSEQERKVFWF